MRQVEAGLLEIYTLLEARYGQLGWWPADSPFEVCVGAILTQNTSWKNVEKAIIALKSANAVSAEALRDMPFTQLAEYVRPSGFFTVKSKRLKAFVEWLFHNHQGSLDLLFKNCWVQTRTELLGVNGIGPETADSILLYAGAKPSFVVDSYTRRLFSRIGLLPDTAGYDQTRNMFMTSLPEDVQLFNQYHALIVEQCKLHCRVKPNCYECPLVSCCEYYAKTLMTT